jgi:putative MATE family efflux protein
MTRLAFRPLDFDSPALAPLLLKAALPAVAGLSINALHQTVDAIYVGMIDARALAAVSLAMPVLALSAALGVGLGSGTATVAGRLMGEGRDAAAGRLAATAFALALPLGLILGLAVFVLREPILARIGADASLMPEASLYLGIMAICAGLGIVQILADFTAIAEGNARFSMLSLILCFGLNILLDPLLIFGFGLGVAGAALATVIAQLVTLGLYVWYFRARLGRLHLSLGGISLRAAPLGQVARLGLPETGWSLLTALGVLMTYRIAGTHGGPAAIAAIGIALRLTLLGTLPLTGFCLGARAILAHAAGAGDLARFRRAERLIAAYTTGFALLFAAAVLLFAPLIARGFTDDPEVARLAALALGIVFLPFPFAGAHLTLLASLQAMNRPGAAAALGLAPNGYLLLPLLALMPPLLGFAGIPAAFAIAGGLTGVVSALVLARSRLPILPPAQGQTA